MAGPKHLWSGDWEQESTHDAAERAERPRPLTEAPASPEPKRQRWSWRRFTVRQLAAATVALLVIAAVAVALATSGGSSKPTRTTTTRPAATQVPAQPSTGGSGVYQLTAPSRVVTGPTATWLGMQIVTSPLGAVVSTVPINSSGNAAGFEPGDVISAIGNDQISSVKQIRAAVANTALGDRIQITISRGSGIITAAVTLTDRPTIQP